MSSLSTLWTFLLKRGRVAFLLAAMGMVWGFSAYQAMPRESSPEIEVPIGIITTALPGASAPDMEKLVTEKIEREVKKLEDIEKYTSTSQAGFSSVVVEFEAGTEMLSNMQKLREALDDAERDLPDSILDDPNLDEASGNNLPIFTLNLSGDFSMSELKRFGEDLEESIESIQGVKDVLISGLPEEAVHIYLDPLSLQNIGLSVEQVAQKIQAAHRDVPMGQIFVDGERIDLRLTGELESVTDFATLPIAQKDGQVIALDQIAEIRRAFESMKVKTYFTAGSDLQPSITLDVIKSEAKTNIARVIDDVFATLEEYRANDLLPEALEASVIFNQAEDIQKDLNNLIVTGGQTLILITIILLFALGWRESLLAFVAIPLSMLLSIGFLHVFGETFNFLSLFSLILSVGLLVDNAIIMVEGVSENIVEKRQKPLEAAANALITFRWPIITGTATTIFAFLPMMFLISGVSGQFIRIIPLTVTVVLLCSLAVSLFIIPVFAALFFQWFPPKHHTPNKTLQRVKAWYGPFMARLLSSSKKVWTTLGITFLVFVFSVAMPILGFVPLDIFPGSDENFFTAKIELPKGTNIEATESLIPEIKEKLLPLFDTETKLGKDLRNAVIIVGQVSNFDPEVLRGAGAQPEEEVIGMTFNLKEKKNRTITSRQAADLVESVLAQVVPPYAELSMGQLEGGPPSGSSAIEIRLISEHLDHLEQVTEDLRTKLGQMELRNGDQLTQITDNRGDILPQITWRVDREKLERFGLSLSQITQTLRSAIQGIKVLELTEGDEEVDVEMRLDFSAQEERPYLQWEDPENLDILRNIPLRTPAGAYISLEEIATFSIAPARSVIRHRDGKRSVTVGANIQGKSTASQFQKDLEQAIASLDKWPGDRFEIGGDNEESFRLVREMAAAMLFAVFLITLILVLQFNSYLQPLVIVAAIPLSLTAVFLGFWLSQTPISFPTMIGIVALAGIIVNDDIVLIDRINHHQDRNNRQQTPLSGDNRQYVEGLIEGCKARMQPIFLTSITTVVGMLPLALSDPIWEGLGFAVIYGMAFSTILTLLLTPCILQALHLMEIWVRGKLGRKRS